ncbi:TonB-dependent receptor [Sphingomonas sp. YL-JM2C]
MTFIFDSALSCSHRASLAARLRATAAAFCAVAAPLAPLAAQAASAPSDAAAAADGADVNDIIVTATRRSERLSDVPIAVSAFSQESLTNARVENTIDLANVTPGLAVAKQAGGQIIFLRGVGSADGTAGQEAAVATYIDGVYIAAAKMGFSALNNIDHVEVLKGPQGTLFGRNATGGLIQIITRTPTHTPTVEGSLSYGNYDTVAGKLYASTGLTDAIAMDVAVALQRQGDGYGTNLTTGRDVGIEEYSVVRSKLVFDNAGPVRAVLTGDYSKNMSRSDARVAVPGVVNLDGARTPAGFWDTNTGVDPLYVAKGWGVSARIDAELSDKLTLVSISAYREGKARQRFDNDLSVTSATDVQTNELFKTFTQEIQLQSAADGPFTWILGGFYMKDRNGFRDPVGLGLFGTSFGGGVGISNVVRTNSYSVFGEGTYALTDQLRLRAGARYTIDKRRLTGTTFRFAAADGTVVTRRPFTPPTPISATPVVPKEATFKDPSYRVVLDYKPSDNVLLYTSYSRGFKSGSFNATSGTAPSFEPETIDAIEIGAKGSLSRAFRFGIAGYHYWYDDLQLPVSNGTSIQTSNAAKSKIYGIDLDMQLSITREWSVSLGGAWTHARYTSYPSAQCTERLPTTRNRRFRCDVSGNAVARTPEYSFTAGGNYTLKTEAGTFSANGTLAYNDGFPWDADNRLRQDAYWLLSGQIGWRSPSDRWGVNLFGRNLLNTRYSVYESAVDFGDQRSVAPPRTYGVELSWKL